jgi:SpoVK/Ycf46/Vps4 family AAA+-type ATPase
MECFYHQKVFSPLVKTNSFLWLVVPNEAILWAGPYLADLAHHLGSRGRVVVPGSGEAYFEIQGRALQATSINIEVPWDDLGRNVNVIGTDGSAETVEASLRLSDIAGYREIRERVDELIIWPERHRRSIRKPSRSSGILFFGPPGCGKSRLARAIAGELEQEVRLLSPSDLRGAYVGWGQIMIREQFDWVAEHEHQMLVIDELDAVARSRRMDAGMISDEMANVNELLVQLDRVSRLGRLVVGTTNFIGSLDDAVIRSGRFGRFIPVPPPDIDEAVAIVDYYLRRLEADIDDENQPRVQVPSPEDVRLILEPLVARNRQNENFFCGADLEEAVNRTYLRCLRDALSGVSRSEGYSKVAVRLTKSELETSLTSVPRSVRADAMEQFGEDEARYCGGAGRSGAL